MGPLRGIVILLAVTKLVESELLKLASGNVAVGVGYSSDSQQIVPQRCYNATVSSVSGQQGYVKLDSAQSFSDLENILGISVSISGKYGLFSAEAKARYTRSVRDTDYSMSLNYYQYTTNNVAVQIAGYGEDALTESGRGFYNGGKNPHFGLLCGDYYIGSYQQGALLSMGINIKFSSSEAKREFVEKAAASFGDIVGAAESIKSVVSKYNINGSIVMQAFQMGGEPSQLAKVLNKDSSGQYYALSCSLTDMDKCIKAASGLLDYAKDQFSSQFSTKNNTGLTPLGVAFTQYVPIKYLGITPPASLVTTEVAQYRNELFSKLMENEYYLQKLYPFFNKGYPVELDDDFLRSASPVLSKANRNVGILMQEHGGAADCFHFPDDCKSIKAGIDSQLKDITTNDLHFLEDIRHTITTTGGMFYNAGKSWLSTWIAVPDNDPGKNRLVEVKSVSIKDDSYSYYTVVNFTYDTALFEVSYESHKSFEDKERFEGILHTKRHGSNIWSNGTSFEFKLISPFYFVTYNIT